MKKIILICFCLVGLHPAWSQVQKATSLQPDRIKGGRFLKWNLSYGDYSTTRFRRTLGSFFSFRTPQLANLLMIEGVPLYRKDKRRSKDVFHFKLMKGEQPVSYVDSRAIFRKNETFRLFPRQDSSFFGKRNVDYLQALIQVGEDTANRWSVVASNLNGSKDEEQKGVIRKGAQEISFVKTGVLLREKRWDQYDINSLMTTLQSVYAFTYNNEVVGAVSFRKTERKVWLKEELDEEIKTVISSVSALLTRRRQLYR